MENLLRAIENLKNTEVSTLVETRMKEFREMGRNPNETIFEELCFCILAANFNAERSLKIQKEIGNRFLSLSTPRLAAKLRQLGHRFPKTRAKYIVRARQYKDSLGRIIDSSNSCYELRDWLARNVYGIGYKEASHFLRNLGFTDLAILDFHIVDILARCGSIERPKTLTRKKYLEIEEQLRKLACKSGLNLAELDLYLWFMETGKIVK